MIEALLRVDVQNDFCPGGALGVDDGEKVVRPLNLVAKQADQREFVTFDTQDWHPERTPHFDIWPVHCVQETSGAQLRSDLFIPELQILIRKGMGQEHGYSAFEGSTTGGMPLPLLLRRLKVDGLVVGGLTTEYCVKNTVLDALNQGYRVTVLEDAIRPVAPGSVAERLAIEEMKDHGAIFSRTRSVLDRWR